MKKHLILMLAISYLTTMGIPVFADFFDSPTNYVPAISDVWVCNSNGGTLSVLNGVTGAIIKTITLPAGAKPTGIVFRPDYKAIYVAGGESSKVYYITNYRVTKTITLPAGSGFITMHPTGNFAYLSSGAGVFVLDTNPRSPTFQTVIKTIPVTNGWAVAFTHDGKMAYSTIGDWYGSLSQVVVIDASTHTLFKTIQLPIPTAPTGIAITPDGQRVYVSGWVSNNVSVIDSNPASPTYNTVIKTIPVSGEARGIALSPSGNLAYVALDTGGVDVIVTASSSSQFNQVIKHVPAAPFGGIHSVATSLDGRFTYVTLDDIGYNTLYVIDSEPFSATFNSVIKTITVGDGPAGLAVKPH